MLALLFKPEIDDPAHCFGGIAKVLSIACNERCRTATVAKLKLLDGRPQFSDEVWAQLQRQVPFGFGAIAAIGEEVSDPSGGVESFHREIYFVLQSRQMLVNIVQILRKYELESSLQTIMII